MQDKYKEVAVVLIAGMIVFIVLAAAFVFILLFYQRKRFFHMKQLSDAEQKYMEQLFRAQLEIQEQTLKKISLEIHDNIGQVLSLAKLQLGTIDVSDTGALKDRINDSRQLVARAIKDLRDLSHTLDADQVSHIGLLRALEAIDSFKPDHLILDAISACVRMGSQQAAFDYLMRLVAVLKERSITCLITNQTNSAPGACEELSGIGFSSVVDTVVQLRFVDTGPEIGRQILVVKSRGSGHSNRREPYFITDQGIEFPNNLRPPSARAGQANHKGGER